MPKVADILILEPEEHINGQGNKVHNGHSPYTDRYRYDFEICPSPSWRQYDTWQDASYLGIWVNIKTHVIVTYAEGDLSIVECATEESYHAELESMAEFYGPKQRPAFTVIDDQGNVTKIYDPRPE
jgi:hypothetical protein